MGKENPKPKYVRRKTGELVPIEVYEGLIDRPDAIDPENPIIEDRPDAYPPTIILTEEEASRSVIAEEELDKLVGEYARRNYNTLYKPIVDAIKNHGPLTLDQISQITGRSTTKDGKYLERLYRAKLVEKNGNVYSITDENLKDLISVFGTI